MTSPLNVGALSPEVRRAIGGSVQYVDSRYTICTSTTRPRSPTHGSLIYETDTRRMWRWDGANWVWVTGNAARCESLLSSPTFSVPNFTVTALPWASASQSDASMWNISTPTRIVVPITGIYNIGYMVQFNTAGSGGAQAWMGVNGLSGRRYGQTAQLFSGQFPLLTGSATVGLFGGNFIELALFQNSPGGVIINPFGDTNYMQAVLVSQFA